MAIYHYSQKPVPRGEGRSAVAGAAYRSASRLYDQRLGQTFDYERKRGVEHAEIVLPSSAAKDDNHWARDRAALWNAAEAAERRKDARIAREHEIALPHELNKKQQIELLRAFSREIADRYNVAVDFALHRPHRAGDERNFHAHIYSTTRVIEPEGLGAKASIEWSDTDRAKRGFSKAKHELKAMRAKWEELANEHLARAGLEIRIDHRSLKDQGIELVPGRKLGLSRERQQARDLPEELGAKVAEHRAIAAENGRRIIEDPGLALKALTHTQATFTQTDIAKYLHTRTDGAEQFEAAYLRVSTSQELVALGRDDRGKTRYSTREMLQVERDLFERAERMAAGREHAVGAQHRERVLAKGGLSDEQGRAFEHLVGGDGLSVLVGLAGTGKSTALKEVRCAWEAQGLSVKGASLSGKAAEELEQASGIKSRTLASWEFAWAQGRDPLSRGDVFVVDEAGLIGTRQLERVLGHAEKAGAKVVLVGDHEQLQAIEAGAAFRGIAAQVGMVELTEVHRQRHGWQKEATGQLAKGQTGKALAAYADRQAVQAAPTREAAREAMLAAWHQAGEGHPRESRLMLAYTRDDVRQLNTRARELRAAAGELGHGEIVETERGRREFAAGDRIYFLRNDNNLGVKNGTLATIEKIDRGLLQVRLDGPKGQPLEGRRLVVDAKQYAHLDHGYAATLYKAQGVTVDRSFVLATPHFDRHSTYVALTRHRESATVFYGREDFQPEWSRALAEENFRNVLSTARSKELAHDYLDRDQVVEPHAITSADMIEPKIPTPASAVERLRQRSDEVAQRLAVEREQERARKPFEQQQAPEPQRHKALEQEVTKQHEKDHGLEL